MERVIQPKIQCLGDLELAILTSLIAEQHCVIAADGSETDEVSLALVNTVNEVFNLSCVAVECGNGLTLDDFRETLLVEHHDENDYDGDYRKGDYDTSRKPLPSFNRLGSRADNQHRSESSGGLDERRIANVIVAKNLDKASEHVQVQALELIKTKRLFTHAAMYSASKIFLLVALNERGTGRKLSKHLNDLFSISHDHESFDDGRYRSTPQLKRKASSFSARSTTSLRRSVSSKSSISSGSPPHISSRELDQLRESLSHVSISSEVLAYMQNVVVFLRWHRYIAGGVTALAVRHLRTISKALALLHGIDYVTPSLVALAVRKVFAHRMILSTVETERSMQWGSDAVAVERLLRDVTPESAIDTVLATVETPL